MLPAERGCRVRRARRRLSEQCPLRRFRLTPSWEKGPWLPVGKLRPQTSEKVKAQLQTLSAFRVLALYTSFS